MIRSALQLSSKQSISFHIGNQLLAEDMPIRDIYEQRKDEDGFLYVTYSDLEVFG